MEDSCIAASDWLTQVDPVMADISDRSGFGGPEFRK